MRRMKTFDKLVSGDNVYIRVINSENHTVQITKHTVESVKAEEGNLTEFVINGSDDLRLLKSEVCKGTFWTNNNSYVYADKTLLLFDLYNEKEHYINKIDEMIENIGINI